MSRFLPIGILRCALGVFFVVLGLADLVPGLDASVFSLPRRWEELRTVAGALELASGTLLLTGILPAVRHRTRGWVPFVVFVIWVARLVIVRFFIRLSLTANAVVFEPSFTGWILLAACEVVIASALFTVYSSD